MDQFTVKEAAAYIGISAHSMRCLYQQKKIKHRRVGPGRGIVRFEKEWLDDYLAGSIVEVVGGAKKRQRPTEPEITPTLKIYSLEELERQLG